MSRRRVALLVAMVTALAGAPSLASAAEPNQLSQASVSPASGNDGTLFVVTARYRSPAGHPAIAVTAHVGDSNALLLLVSGTTTDGVWSGTAVAPPGSWNVTVHAAVAQGVQPTVSAGTITVADVTEPSFPPEDLPSLVPGTGDEVGAVSTPAPAPAHTPRPKAAATPAPARSSNGAAPSQPPTGPTPGGAAPAGPGRSGEAPRRSARPDPASSNDGAQRSPGASPSTSGVPTPAGGRDDLGLFMLVGTLAVGTVALVGSAWVIVAGRRERLAATAPAQPRPTDPGVIAATIVEQRALRRARLRSSDDPILAAMGLPDEDATPNAAPPRRTGPRSGRGRRKPPAS